MTDIPSVQQPKKFNVLMITAAVVSCEAISEVDAAQRALIEAPPLFDPSKLEWVVKLVSDKPIFLGDPGDEEELTAEAEAEATTPKLEIIK